MTEIWAILSHLAALILLIVLVAWVLKRFRTMAAIPAGQEMRVLPVWKMIG